MTTITITNPTDTAVAGKTDLREAVAAAQSGDTIVLASGSFGDFIQLKAPLIIAAGKNLTIDFGAGEDNGINGSVIVNTGAVATIADAFISNQGVGANSPDHPANGAGGVAGQNGIPGEGTGGQNGGGGGNGASATDPGADALGAIQNSGVLKLINDTIVGSSVAGSGASGGRGGDGAGGGNGSDSNKGPGGGGGNGGSGGPGGAGTSGGSAVGAIFNAGGAVLTLQDTFISGSATAGAGGNGGNGGQGAVGGQGGPSGPAAGGGGGKGGGGGASGVSGNGGNAVGGILNDGTIDVIGAAILYNDSATAGAGGTSGQSAGAKGGKGGAGNPAGATGANGASGAVGKNGINGVAQADELNNGTIVGALTVDGAYVSIKKAIAGPTVVNDGTGSIFASVTWTTQFTPAQPGVDDGPSSGTVDWEIVSGPGGPALSDFTSWAGVGTPGAFTNATQGTLDLNVNGNQVAAIRLNFTPTAAEPSNESFMIELLDPSAHTVLGSASSLTVNFVNPLAGGGTPPPTVTGDILFQNSSTGQASIWDVTEGARTGGGPVSPNPGITWRVIGTGDFNKDGHADILWQNANGQASIWEMNGTTKIGGGPAGANPGPSWKAVGSGDFNGDGKSDILWQNASGQASIWEMDGNTKTGGGALATNPGPSWKAVGTGDFNKDGDADILWQNTSTGLVSIWEMQGNTRIGGGAVNINPGPAWQAIGSGDFFNRGFDDDILFQNKSTGQVSVWEMDGTTKIGGGGVANPGTSWHAIGTGAGGSDILLQNISGQASIWEMDGATKIGGGALSPNPGTTWRAVGLA
jgi:FG-GAP-like repeat